MSEGLNKKEESKFSFTPGFSRVIESGREEGETV